jgi:membrane protein YqaA with SNARE-associated domain
LISSIFVAIISRAGRLLAELSLWLIMLGSPGLFLMSLLDSALVPLPSGPDWVLLALSAAQPRWMPVYAVAAAAGSTVGCTLLYLAARRAGASTLKGVSQQRRIRIENLLGRYDMLAVMVPAILPPPFPFKVFVLSAGAFKLNLVRFITAIAIGRAARFLIEGWLAIEFGEDARLIIARHGPKLIIAAALALLAAVALKIYRRRSRLSADELPATGRDL